MDMYAEGRVRVRYGTGWPVLPAVGGVGQVDWVGGWIPTRQLTYNGRPVAFSGCQHLELPWS